MTKVTLPPPAGPVKTPPLPKAVEELYLVAWGRRPSPDEGKKAEGWVNSAPTVRDGLQDLLWVLINSREFQFNK